MSNIMIDIETFDLTPRAKIIQIGAVRFTLRGEVDRANSFICNIDPICEDNLKRDVSETTLGWWRDQPQRVRETWNNPPRIPLKQGLIELEKWIRTRSVEIWAWPMTFDLPILRDAYKQCEIACPWHYKMERDGRTVWEMLAIPERKKIREQVEKLELMEHYALDDAIEQAYMVGLAKKMIDRRIIEQW